MGDRRIKTGVRRVVTVVLCSAAAISFGGGCNLTAAREPAKNGGKATGGGIFCVVLGICSKP